MVGSHSAATRRESLNVLKRRDTQYDFETPKSKGRRASCKGSGYGVNLEAVFLGIAALVRSNGDIEIAFVTHDGTYSIDFACETLESQERGSPSKARQFDAHLGPDEIADMLADYFVEKIREYAQDHNYKFVGLGMTKRLQQLSPELPARLWSDLDIVPLVFDRSLENFKNRKGEILVDGEADSMARKCLSYFGPTLQPTMLVSYQNEVRVDAGGHAHLAWRGSYQESVANQRTWDACMKYASSLRDRKMKIAFFSSTPQGGGVALMRHALIRLFRIIGVDCKWYVPNPKPEVFRITKTNHNILQGVADSKERLTEAQQEILKDWCYQNAERFWICEDGPMRPRSEGGVDIVIVDDPQMPDLVPIAKQQDPSRPVIWRSHIQVRADLANTKGTPTAEVWSWLWTKVKAADVIISHPVREFVPNDVPVEKVGYMPATTDWLDGLNKDMDDYHKQYYIHQFNTECYKNGMIQLAYPTRDYIIQIARFDPAKGIPDVLGSYAELRRTYLKDKDSRDTPQLVIAGHGAVDDPDASLIYEQTMDLIENEYPELKSDIVVMRVGPTDQTLNALLSNAKIALQLSTREGFEVKVSEAIHKSKPIIATKAGGIPLQVAHEKSGFLVEPGDTKAVAKYMHHLLTDEAAYQKMSEYAGTHVSDEVGTVGNALCWLFLADELSQGKDVLPKSKWINDMARETAGLPYEKSENHLPRPDQLDLTSSAD